MALSDITIPAGCDTDRNRVDALCRALGGFPPRERLTEQEWDDLINWEGVREAVMEQLLRWSWSESAEDFANPHPRLLITLPASVAKLIVDTLFAPGVLLDDYRGVLIGGEQR